MRVAATVLIFALFMSVFCSAHAATWYIKADGTGDAPTIQAGIDSAAVGDIVLVAAGTYTGLGNKDLDFGGKDLVLRSEVGPEVTIIDCEESGRALSFHSGEGPDAVVEGFTIRNGYLTGYSYGGGIFCENSSPTVANCLISENSDSWGGGMCCSGSSSPMIADCTFWGNSSDFGGGMRCVDSSPVIADCTFYGNSAGFGAGLYCENSFATVTNCIFSENSAIYRGGGIHCFRDLFSPSITNCTFSGNSAAAGGAVSSYDWASPTITNCTLSGNSANYGSGVYCYGSASTILENTIIAFSTQGNGVHCDLVSTATLTCCNVFGNAEGDWIGCIADQYGVNSNISEDPVFCGEANHPGDPYRLDTGSPCAVRNSPCGELLGARPAGCSEGVATESATWGKVKTLYR